MEVEVLLADGERLLPLRIVEERQQDAPRGVVDEVVDELDGTVPQGGSRREGSALVMPR